MKRITFLITLLFALTCQAQLLWKVSGGTLENRVICLALTT